MSGGKHFTVSGAALILFPDGAILKDNSAKVVINYGDGAYMVGEGDIITIPGKALSNVNHAKRVPQNQSRKGWMVGRNSATKTGAAS